jgi:DNA-binding GntR family transcriptional regulator
MQKEINKKTENRGLLQPTTLRFEVEKYLRQAIITGQYQSGERLIERELCELLKVSRASLREALRTLEAEKLIYITPYRGPVVATINKKEAEDLLALRALVEGYAAREFAKQASDEQIQELGKALKAMLAEASSKNQQKLVKAKAHFYDVLLNGTENNLLAEIHFSLLRRGSLLRNTSIDRPERLSHALEEVQALYESIAKRDPDLSQKAAEKHIREIEKFALSAFEDISNNS